ncbi:MAG: sigma-70 family RNA polymerase sigma factor [Planctomycetes bacterium]|nr:sigma-70 family RNA polymerase sigma factor [Planctomycetota bacterium]
MAPMEPHPERNLRGAVAARANNRMGENKVHALETERRWIAEAQEGSAEAFGRLVERHERAVFAFVLTRARNLELAQELVQETFVRAFEGLERFDTQQPLVQWLMGIAHHVTSEWRRSQASQRRALDTVEQMKRARKSSVRAPVVDEMPLHERILGAIDACPDNYREPLVLRYLDKLSYEEIAERLALSPGQVKGILYRGKQLLRANLEREAPKEGEK